MLTNCFHELLIDYTDCTCVNLRPLRSICFFWCVSFRAQFGIFMFNWRRSVRYERSTSGGYTGCSVDPRGINAVVEGSTHRNLDPDIKTLQAESS